MEHGSFVDCSIRQRNRYIISQNPNCQKTIDAMREIEEFLCEFGFLSFGRDFIVCRSRIFSLQMVLTACELTSGSIIACCESGCMADAFSLLRKYRDDLFFYLYMVEYDSSSKQNAKSQKLLQMENNIERWINNDLCDLPIGTVMQAIGSSPQVKDAVTKYNLQSFFNTIGDRLNNYVHSNGVSFYNLNVNSYQGNSLQRQMETLLKDMRFVTISFMFLLALCSPISIMSTDYIDYLDCNAIPPEESQYWVAPFVAEFFKNNIDLIDKSCIAFLEEHTLMQFEQE